MPLPVMLRKSSWNRSWVSQKWRTRFPLHPEGTLRLEQQIFRALCFHPRVFFIFYERMFPRSTIFFTVRSLFRLYLEFYLKRSRIVPTLKLKFEIFIFLSSNKLNVDSVCSISIAFRFMTFQFRSLNKKVLCPRIYVITLFLHLCKINKLLWKS